MYGILAAGFESWPIIKQLAWLMGKLMNVIYNVMDGVFGIENIGICIIIFTIIIYTLMIPLTIKQQKWSKMTTLMNPELQKINKKYEGKKDQASMMKKQEEMNMIYEQYGVSPTGGCLPMLIQMPLLFSLYPVIQNIPQYVERVRDVYTPVVTQIMSFNGFQKVMEDLSSGSPIVMSASAYDFSKADTIVRALYKFQPSHWASLVEKFPSISELADTTVNAMSHLNSFIGINIGTTPWNMLMDNIKTFSIGGIILAIIIPVAAGASQFLSVKLQPQAAQTADTADNPMANSMKSMTYTMPLMSVFFGFTLPAGLGLYWAISAIVRCVQQIAINKYMDKIPMEQIIEENRQRNQKKREKAGTKAEKVNSMATTSTKNYNKTSTYVNSNNQSKYDEAIQKSQNAKPGSLASKANMVNRYNSGVRLTNNSDSGNSDNK